MDSGMWKSTRDDGINPKYFNFQKKGEKNLNKFGGERGGEGGMKLLRWYFKMWESRSIMLS